MDEIQCEMCVYGIWDRGDKSVGIEPYLDDCGIEHGTARRHFEIIIEDGNFDHRCPFFIKQNMTECEIVRCPKCNSRHTSGMGIDSDVFEYKINFKCNTCGNVFIEDVPWM